MTQRPSYGVVVLTQGRRPDDLQRGLGSLLAQTGVDLDIAVVGNGWQPVGLPEGVHAVALAENVGIPAGRNAGVPHVRGELLFFLDDDARLREEDTLERLARMLDDQPDIGLIQPRVLDPAGRPAPRRWVPRLRAGDPARSSDVTALWEGAIAMRRDLFDRIGGWAGEFFYAHEGIDLAWAVWDAGFRARYCGEVTVLHPAIEPTRHSQFYRLQARNRVFLARRRLPVLLGAGYLLTWAALTMVRVRSLDAARGWFAGTVEGFRSDAGPRRPMSWHTAWRMAKAGRPPLI